MAKDAIGIKSYTTYVKTLNNLVEWGFIQMIEKSKNQYSSNIIALPYNSKALGKALDKAIVKHVVKQVESTCESIVSIDKPLTIEPLTNKPRTDDIVNYENKKYQEIVNIFNSTCTELTKAGSLSVNRLKSIKEIEKEYGLENIGIVFTKINESDYLNGSGKDGWKANFDWVLKPDNFAKILEDYYKTRKNGKTTAKKSNVEYDSDFLAKIARGLQS